MPHPMSGRGIPSALPGPSLMTSLAKRNPNPTKRAKPMTIPTIPRVAIAFPAAI